MDYFHICLECVRKLSIGKTKHLMLKALADTMGGYLKVYILPLTKHSFYAGNIKYRNARRLFELFEELKNFLHTNGDGWRKPTLVGSNHVKIPPIIITPSRSSAACNGLVTYPACKILLISTLCHFDYSIFNIFFPTATSDMNFRNYQSYPFKKKRLAHRRELPARRSARGKREYAIELFVDFWINVWIFEETCYQCYYSC